MSKPETLSDIIAEKRRLAEQMRNNLSTGLVRQWHQQAEIKSLEDEADRLDRARMKMEIEIANLRKENAKLRDALTKVKEWMEHRIATRGFEASATFPTMLEDVVLPALATTSSQTKQEDNQ